MPGDSASPDKTAGVGSYDSMEFCELGLVKAHCQRCQHRTAGRTNWISNALVRRWCQGRAMIIEVICSNLKGFTRSGALKSSRFTSSSITFKFAAELESLLRRNASTLKVVKLIKARLPRNVDHALRCLENCESLTLHSYYDWDRRFPSLVSVAQLLHTSSALKELSIIICPIKRKKQVTTIAEAIKANTSLTKLSVFSGDILYSPEPIFAALLVNKTLKELQLQQCNFDAPCGRSTGNSTL
ncbi:hypothetical protein MRX96_039549 [Rhipicephalus microplus]